MRTRRLVQANRKVANVKETTENDTANQRAKEGDMSVNMTDDLYGLG